MENNNDNVRLNKIPLLIFIETLQEVYQMGVDYVDIVGTNNVDQDVIAIYYNDKYFAKGENPNKEEGNDSDEDDFEYRVDLSDEDLNDLT
jgi:hypothetical protein